jgi:hypothetical protein
MTRYLAIIFLGFVVGCSFAPGGRISHSLYTREVLLSTGHPQDDFIKAKLVAVAEDGTTTSQVVQTGETLRAPLGECFVSTAYGKEGLRLISASAEKQEARLLRTWCETK